MFVRIEPASAVPIYRQIVDQVKYQIATGVLQPGDKVPSVRQLAAELAVNQNTILKVYNQLCQENVLRTERGSGTVVAESNQTLSKTERKRTVANLLREAAVQCIHLDIPLDQAQAILDKEYQSIVNQKERRS